MTQVFLSHSTRDAEFAAWVAERLREADIAVWKSPESILPGEDWVDAIERGLTTSSHFVLLMSPDSAESDWVDFEFNNALRLQRAGHMTILPVDYIRATVPLFWKHYQAIKILHGDEKGIRELIERINAKAPALPPEPTSHPTINITITGNVEGDVQIAGRDLYEKRPEKPPSKSIIPDSLLEGTPLRRSDDGEQGGKLPLGIIGIVGVVAAVIIGVIAISNANGQQAADVTPDEPDVQPGDETETTPDATEQTPSPTPTDEPTSTATPTTMPEQTAMELAVEGVEANGEWQPFIQEFDGVEMALVPAGCFMMGTTNPQLEEAFLQVGLSLKQSQDELPQHEQCFDAPFWIDVYEVTNLQFSVRQGEAKQSSTFTNNDLPRQNLTWNESRLYCEKRDARLPTEREWEYAARGPDGLIFPWGDSYESFPANICDKNCANDWANLSVEDGFRNMSPVGSYPDGVSWVGAYDMAGNMWEWTSTLYRFPYPYAAGDGRENTASELERTIRGGSFRGYLGDLRGANRWLNIPYFGLDYIGVRCARDFEG